MVLKKTNLSNFVKHSGNLPKTNNNFTEMGSEWSCTDINSFLDAKLLPSRQGYLTYWKILYEQMV